MTRDELTDRVIELFPPLAEVKPWEWAETDEGEPVVMIERHATFTGLDSGDVDLTAPIPNTSKIGVWRIEPSGHYALMGLMDDPHRDGGSRAGEATSSRPPYRERERFRPLPNCPDSCPLGTNAGAVRRCGGIQSVRSSTRWRRRRTRKT